MLAWHLAAITFLFRWIFRDPKVDMRFLAAGAVLADVVDLTAATIIGSAHGELWGHSLALPTMAGTVVLLSTRRGRRRRAWMALVVAWMLHLLIDRMWLDAGTFLWPVLGWDVVGETGASFWSGAWERALSDPWRWILEAVGIGYLVWLSLWAGLRRPQARARLVATGRLGEGARGDVTC
ncbi:MAG: hypothetical protein ACLFWM_06420 [Actinomycetota bacterium]